MGGGVFWRLDFGVHGLGGMCVGPCLMECRHRVGIGDLGTFPMLWVVLPDRRIVGLEAWIGGL